MIAVLVARFVLGAGAALVENLTKADLLSKPMLHADDVAFKVTTAWKVDGVGLPSA